MLLELVYGGGDILFVFDTECISASVIFWRALRLWLSLR